jgi:5'-methylthioadenosine phosphorylase
MQRFTTVAKATSAAPHPWIILHQGNQLNPYINYPFLTVEPLRQYVKEAHAAGAKVKLYYTVRELSTSATELWALRSLNVRWIIAVTAVGSLKEEYEPRDIVLPDQFFDRTSQRAHHTFFGEGIVAHVGFSDPISEGLRELLFTTATDLGKRVHNRGTYVNMDGPAFSTRAESETNRKLGFDLIGMTNLPEAKLAREAEIALATLAMITDYDCWKIEEDAVSAHSVIEHVHANAATAREILQALIPRMPATPDWPEHRSLDSAIFTDQSLWPEATTRKLEPLLQRFLKY